MDLESRMEDLIQVSMVFSVKKDWGHWIEVVLIFENPIHHLKRSEIQRSILVVLLR